MCIGSQPQVPQIVYQGPSQDDITRNAAALESYRAESTKQQQQFAEQLQQQIDRANAQASEQRARLDQEQQLAAAELAAQQQGAYAATATESEPAAAVTTTAAMPKEKRRTSLKIAPGATASAAGAGLNIGV